MFSAQYQTMVATPADGSVDSVANVHCNDQEEAAAASKPQKKRKISPKASQVSRILIF